MFTAKRSRVISYIYSFTALRLTYICTNIPSIIVDIVIIN